MGGGELDFGAHGKANCTPPHANNATSDPTFSIKLLIIVNKGETINET